MSTSRNAPCPCGSGKKYKLCCLRNEPVDEHPGYTPFSSRVVTRQEMCISDEVKHIRACAVAGEAHIVTLGQLLFFSTATGDAWVLDPEDQLSTCLMTEGLPLPVAIDETAMNFRIAWGGRYTAHEQSFIVTDASGRTTTYADYPVLQIVRASRGGGMR